MSRLSGVEGTGGISTAVRLRLVGDLYGPLKTTITSFEGRRKGLLTSIGLSAVGGRARLLVVVGGNGAATPRSRAVAARGALGAPAAAVGYTGSSMGGEVWYLDARGCVSGFFLYIILYL